MNSEESQYLLKLTSKRGEIIDFVAASEMIMSKFISLHYFGKIKQDFINEVLEDEYFSLHLRTKLLEKLLKKYEDINFPFKQWRKLQRIRNIVAHTRKDTDIHIDLISGKRTMGKSYYMYQGEKKEAEEIHSKFEELKEVIFPSLQLLLRKFGLNLAEVSIDKVVSGGVPLEEIKQ